MPKQPVPLVPVSRSKSELSMAEQLSQQRQHGHTGQGDRQRATRTAVGSRDAQFVEDDEDSMDSGWSPKAWHRRYLALKRFQSMVRSVIMAIRWMKSVINRYDYSNNRVARALKPFDVDASNAADLAFNMSQFRARKEIELSAELKQILQLQPQQRSSEQVRSLTRGLQRLPTFNEYPLRVQEKLARVARYHTVPPGRVIIRQGHAGVNFYVIISGRALVHVMQQQRDTIVARLGQGQAFGEVALMQEVTRTASIVSQEAMQLLAIGRDDFQEIFTNAEPDASAGSDGKAGIPDHLRYLLGCSFMRYFPQEPLLSNPGACRAGCYRRNAVVVADSKTCSDLVVIRSGFCRVMKRLLVNRSDSPRLSEDCAASVESHSSRSGGSSSTRASKATGLAETVLPALQPSSGPSYAKIDTGLAKPKRHQFNFENSKKRLGLESLSAESSLEYSSLRQSFPPLKPPPLPPSLIPRRPPVPRLVVTTDDGRMDFSIDASNVEEVSAAVAASSPDAPLTEGDDDKKFVAVEICILKPGDVFGLSDIMFKDEKIHEVEDSASVSLVSNGAECVLLSKAFFVQHAPELVRRRVRAAVQPYPSEQVFEQNYYTQVAWNRYRRTVFKLALNRALATGASRKAAARSSVK